VTSNGEQDNARELEDDRVRRSLIFHGLTEGLHGMTDGQLIEWVLEEGLRLQEPSQYIEEINRFGKHRVRPIRVRVQTADKREYILSTAKTFSVHDIVPFHGRREEEIRQELISMRKKFIREGYENVIIESPKLVHVVNGKPNEVLYNAVGDCDSVMSTDSRSVIVTL